MKVKVGRPDRLAALVEHVTGPDRGHKKFDFSRYNSRGDDRCGSAGCALGEAPVLWSRDWCWKAGVPELRLGRRLGRKGALDTTSTLERQRRLVRTATLDAAQWFGITEKLAYHLFLPEVPYRSRPGLPKNCTAEQWAEHARSLLSASPQPLSGAELEEHRMTNFEHGMGYQ